MRPLTISVGRHFTSKKATFVQHEDHLLHRPKPTPAMPSLSVQPLWQLGRPLAWIRSRWLCVPVLRRVYPGSESSLPPLRYPSPAISYLFLSYTFCFSLSISALSLSYPLAFPLQANPPRPRYFPSISPLHGSFRSVLSLSWVVCLYCPFPRCIALLLYCFSVV